jgi:UDP-N-acetylglucosamine diphosphorylase/glucosamine-1-phosphate N-acetyltransferase
MSTIVLFEDDKVADLSPIVWWRTVFELRTGRKIILDRTPQRLGAPVAGVWTRDWIAAVAGQRCGAPANRSVEAGHVLVNGRWLFDDKIEFPDAPCVGTVDDQVAYVVCDDHLARELSAAVMLREDVRSKMLEQVEHVVAPGSMVQYPWDFLRDLGATINADWVPSEAVVESDQVGSEHVGPMDRVHIGPSTTVHPTAVIDATEGPIYISHDVQIGAYALIEGPAYIGPGTRISPFTWLHGGNAIGPVCKIGGEIDGCVFQGYSNKQHDGFLGHAFVGSWVNIGAGATNSDLKNTYSSVRVPVDRGEVDTGMLFLGAIIGDHAKIGIQATIPAGAVIGLGAAIAATRVIPKRIPSFSWVTEDGIRDGDPARLLDVATRAMSRRSVDMTDDEVELFLDLGTRART